ncbi:hypothetical protein [Jeotgalibaca porci]|uniref:hypothetical protein n=1 Tax=Jeotgalibaca porci TaxID=1868793 RepID=UPI00359F654C
MKTKNGMIIRFLKLNGEPVKKGDYFPSEVGRKIGDSLQDVRYERIEIQRFLKEKFEV